MAGKVFISYRRQENPKDARALYERLRREFGDEHVFSTSKASTPAKTSSTRSKGNWKAVRSSSR